MNPLVLFLLGGAVVVAAAKSTRRTAGRFKGAGERTYDGYLVPDNVTISDDSPGVMVGPRRAPVADNTNIDSQILIHTHLPLVGTWEDAAEDYGLLGQVVNPAALSQPNTIFLLVEQCGREDWQCRQNPGFTQGVSAVFTKGEYPESYPKSSSDVFLMRKHTDVGYDLNSVERFGELVQHAITLIHHARSFDWSSNGAWVTDECMGVLVGRRFWSYMAEEAPTLAQTLAIPGNSALGYAEYLDAQGMNDPKAIATQIIQELSGDCAPSGQYNSWTGAIKEFYDWLLQRIYDDLGMIPFEPGQG